MSYLPTEQKKFKVTIEFEVSGDVPDMVTEEHIAGNIASDLEDDSRSFSECVDEIELWGEYYGDYEDIWSVFRHGEIKVSVVETDEEQEPQVEEVSEKKSYKIYHSGGDTELYVTPNGDILNTFVFTGFGNGINSYYQRQMDLAYEILASVGIYINHKTVDIVDQMSVSEARHKGYFDVEDIPVPRNLKVSEDGLIYYHLQDQEMGRGWAVLMQIDPKENHGIFLMQDHRDNVREEIFYNWMLTHGADVEFIEVEDVEAFAEVKRRTDGTD